MRVRAEKEEDRAAIKATVVLTGHPGPFATFSYFIPTMVHLMGTEGLADAGVKEALSQ